MPSVKEIYHKIDDVRIEADSINLNVDGLEALASTQQADIADIKADLANGVTINQPVAVTDNNGSLTVDGTVTANAGTGTFTVAQATASNLKGQVQILNSAGSAVVAPAEVGTAGSPSIDVLSVQGVSSGTPLAVRPRNGAITRTTGTTSGTANTSTQALASNTDRQYLLIQNISDTDMYFNFGAAATTSNLLLTKSGGGIVFESGYVPTDAVNVICSAASKSFFILSA